MTPVHRTSSAHPSLRSAALAAVLLAANAAVPVHADFDPDLLVFDAYPVPEAGSTATPPAYPNAPAGTAAPAPMALRTDLARAAEEQELQEARETVDAYLEQIAATANDVSPFDRELFEQHLSLGLSYQAAGDHEQAIEAFEQAEYLSRINNGLYAPEQFPIIERSIVSYMAQGDLQSAWERRQYLHYLTSQYYGDDSLQVVPTLTSLADWNMASFDFALRAGNNVGFVAGGNTFGGTRSLTPRGRAFPGLFMAQSQYYHAIVNLLDNRRVSPSQLMNLELKLVEAVFLGAHRAGILEDPVFYMDQRVTRTGSRLRRSELNGNSVSFKNGRNAFERMQIYQRMQTQATPLEQIQPTLGLGDWHLLFGRRRTAEDQYRLAATMLEEANLSQTEVAALLDPAVPVQLPWFAPLPNSRRQMGLTPTTPLDYDGWLDISFRLSRYGSASRVKVLATSDNVTPEIERRLRKVIYHAPFRPRLSAMENGDSEQITLRYYFAQMPEGGQTGG